MQESQKTMTNDIKKRVRISTIRVGVLNILALAIGSFFHKFIFISIASVGIITFLGVLTIANMASEDPNFSRGEMRKAITAAVLIFYLCIVALFITPINSVSEDSSESTSNNTGTVTVLPEETIEHIINPFTWLAGSVILFYFGNRALNSVTDSSANKVNSSSNSNEGDGSSG